jgi:hypothetical protein
MGDAGDGDVLSGVGDVDHSVADGVDRVAGQRRVAAGDRAAGRGELEMVSSFEQDGVWRRATARASSRIERRRGVGGRERRLGSVAVYVNGKRVRVIRRTARIDLRGFALGTAVVKVVARTRTGRRVVEVRRYRTCAT